MHLYNLLPQLKVTDLSNSSIPKHLFGAFRRKSISFYNGLTDEDTIVYWFQSQSFTIDLRLKQRFDTSVFERQAWIGDTFWDAQHELLSWQVAAAANYQNHIQWPEPAKLHAIGNCIFEFSPSNVYVEDWRQQVQHGLFLGLKLQQVIDVNSGEKLDMHGGLIICDQHIAFALSRLPETQNLLAEFDFACQDPLYAKAVESFEVSLGFDGQHKYYSSQSDEMDKPFNLTGFSILDENTLLQHIKRNGRQLALQFQLDVYIPNYSFQHQTTTSNRSTEWLARESAHLLHHAKEIL